MRNSDFLGLLRSKATPFFSTRDAALWAGLSGPATTAHLTKLAKAGLLRRVRHGQWALEPKATALAYGAWVTAPLPSYVSLYTALFHRGVIQQIPRIIYVVSLAHSRLVETDLGTYSAHQIAPPLFTGYTEENGVRMATAEKAVFDTLYLGRAHGLRFAGLTEVDLPARFSVKKLRAFENLVADPSVRGRVEDAIDAFLEEVAQS